MNLYISTNVFIPTRFSEIFNILDNLPNNKNIGVEIFPDLKNPNFITDIENSIEKLMKYPIYLHGPSFNIEHSAKKGSIAYNYSMNELNQLLIIGEKINAKYLIFHHNNKIINSRNKKMTLKSSDENLKEITTLGKKYNILVLIENAGVNSIGNNLFTEDEFIDICLSSPNNVLIDIGNAHANNWNLENVISKLKSKIQAFHVHNNNGYHNSNNRILDGSLDFHNFINLYQKYTPNADIIIKYGYHLATKHQYIEDDVLFIRKLLNII